MGVLLSSAVRRPLDRGLCGYDSEGIGGKVVRFHVLANSDSEADQTSSLRCAIGFAGIWRFTGSLYLEGGNACGTQKRTAGNFGNGGGGGAGAGYAYPVRVSLVREEFPLKIWRFDFSGRCMMPCELRLAKPRGRIGGACSIRRCAMWMRRGAIPQRKAMCGFRIR